MLECVHAHVVGASVSSNVSGEMACGLPIGQESNFPVWKNFYEICAIVNLYNTHIRVSGLGFRVWQNFFEEFAIVNLYNTHISALTI